jgi:hypothetical protein
LCKLWREDLFLRKHRNNSHSQLRVLWWFFRRYEVSLFLKGSLWGRTLYTKYCTHWALQNGICPIRNTWGPSLVSMKVNLCIIPFYFYTFLFKITVIKQNKYFHIVNFSISSIATFDCIATPNENNEFDKNAVRYNDSCFRLNIAHVSINFSLLLLPSPYTSNKSLSGV